MTLDAAEVSREVEEIFKRIHSVLDSFKALPSADLSKELKMLKTIHGVPFASRLNSTILSIHETQKALSEVFLPKKYPMGDLTVFNDYQLEMVNTYLEWRTSPKLKEEAERIRSTFGPVPRNRYRELCDNALRPKNVLKPLTNRIFVRKADEHPYADEILNLNLNLDMDGAVLEAVSSVDDGRLVESVPCHWVDSVEALDGALERLCREVVIGVDLEHHSFLSYHGMTCLIQISSPTEDFLLDAIKLREALQSPERSLNRLFANKAILKLVHGAESDIAWMQRDFDTYFVNMFDSYFAAKCLNLSSCSLAFLLKSYCGVEMDKQYQLADWRERPLPEAMSDYARKDTHYLFYLFKRLRHELGAQQVREVRMRSNRQCLVLYRPEGAGPDAWRMVLDRCLHALDAEQVSLVRALFYWREERAQALDISPPAYMPNSSIVRLAQARVSSDKDIRFALNYISQWMLAEMDLAVGLLNSYQSGGLAEEQRPVASILSTASRTHIRYEELEDEEEEGVEMDSGKRSKLGQDEKLEAGQDKDQEVGQDVPSLARPVRVSFATTASVGASSAAGLFGGTRKTVASSVALTSALKASLPIIAPQAFVTREDAQAEAEKQKQAEEKEAFALKAKQEAVPLVIHSTGETVKDLNLHAVSGSSTSVMQQIHARSKERPSLAASVIPHDYASGLAADEGKEQVGEETVFNPYKSLTRDEKQPIIVAAIRPAQGPRLSATPASGNLSVTFVSKGKKH